MRNILWNKFYGNSNLIINAFNFCLYGGFKEDWGTVEPWDLLTTGCNEQSIEGVKLFSPFKGFYFLKENNLLGLLILKKHRLNEGAIMNIGSLVLVRAIVLNNKSNNGLFLCFRHQLLFRYCPPSFTTGSLEIS